MTGKSRIVFLRLQDAAPANSELLRIPCGQCVGCRLDRSRLWATRLMHEAKFHDTSSFITLTYADEHLPPDLSLVKSHFQNFMKRLRQYSLRTLKSDAPIKFYHCGEYGSEEHTQRPHYHAIVYGYKPHDGKLFKVSGDDPVYSSASLDSLWGHGYTTFGDVTYESAAYVARYTMKKINGAKAQQVDPVTGLRPYDRVHLHTGEIIEVLPEYATMSNGLGKKFIEAFTSDVYPQDKMIVNGVEMRPPRYYDDYWDKINPESMDEIKERRKQEFQRFAGDHTRLRLAQREIVKKAQTQRLQRTL